MTEARSEKLQKVLARRGLGSRRELEGWILAGRVSVNGKRAALGDRVLPGDLIRVDGRRLEDAPPVTRCRVLVYHKPVGEVCTRTDPESRRTVFEALPGRRGGRWISVGRLDVNTSGLLIFTDDGELANRLMHPSFGLERKYAARVFGQLSRDDLAAVLSGVELDGKVHRFLAVHDAGGEGRNHWYHVTLGEGRNREVRRVFEARGLTVSRLTRIAYGPLSLDRQLRPGRWEELPASSVDELRAAVDLPPIGPTVQNRARRHRLGKASPRKAALRDSGKGRRARRSAAP